MNPPRVGVIGPRRRRIGLGPFVVRDLVGAGAEVPCFLATSEATRDETRENLARVYGIKARGYLSSEEMLDIEEIDALAILSPAETHDYYLDCACRAGLHVLCEKPFVWECDDLAETAGRILDAFAAHDSLVAENCPWPYTLPCYEALHPDHHPRRLDPTAPAPESFEMFLQPSIGGLQMLGDSLPHVISLLQAVVPSSPLSIEAIHCEGDLESGPMTLRFCCVSETSRTSVRVELAPTRSHPRRAWFALDGRRAEREVDPGSYEIKFTDAGRSVPVADPLTLLVTEFVEALRAPNALQRARLRESIARRVGLLDALVTHYLAARS